MQTQELSGTTALVTGASRGFGRAIALALSKHGADVAGVARDHGRLEELRAHLGDTFTLVAADPVVAGQLLDRHRPRTLVLNAGAAPLPRPIHRQTWQTFGRNWAVDVQQVFTGMNQDERGITLGGGPFIAAWFKDPAGNILEVLQER